MRAQTDSIVKRLAENGCCVADLCREADIARSTWDRWVRGDTTPNFTTWAKVCGAVAEIERRATGAEDAA